MSSFNTGLEEFSFGSLAGQVLRSGYCLGGVFVLWFNINFRSFLSLGLHFDLADFERDVFRPVIIDESRVASAVHEVFRAKVVRVDEPAPEANNADVNAICVSRFSRRRCHGFIANSLFRLGTGCRTTSLILGFMFIGLLFSEAHFNTRTGDRISLVREQPSHVYGFSELSIHGHFEQQSRFRAQRVFGRR